MGISDAVKEIECFILWFPSIEFYASQKHDFVYRDVAVYKSLLNLLLNYLEQLSSNDAGYQL